jgi:hypothetical protein
MHPAMLGFLIGLGVAAFFVISEYTLLKNAANEEAKRWKRKPVFNEQAQKRMKSVIAFAVFLPPAIAIGCWLVLPKLGL